MPPRLTGIAFNALISTALLLGFSPLAGAAVLARDELLTPFAPQAPRKALSLQATSIDPSKPIWVSYSVLAISASERPSGDLVLEASFDGIALPLTDSRMSFAADRMTSMPRTGTLVGGLDAEVGKRSKEELDEALGPELNAALQALVAKKGTILGKTIVKTYAATGRNEVRLLASFVKSSAVQPMSLTVVVGQGEIPAESKDAFSKYTTDPSWNGKVLAAVISFAFAAVWVFKKFRR